MKFMEFTLEKRKSLKFNYSIAELEKQMKFLEFHVRITKTIKNQIIASKDLEKKTNS